jgi:polygalacturonase
MGFLAPTDGKAYTTSEEAKDAEIKARAAQIRAGGKVNPGMPPGGTADAGFNKALATPPSLSIREQGARGAGAFDARNFITQQVSDLTAEFQAGHMTPMEYSQRMSQLQQQRNAVQ